ncbi:MAG: hypothetical protein KGH95_04915 [Thaumarchaeota archaeon]|nr:hypothetical protein [Nitrososphaerota archaeon]
MKKFSILRISEDCARLLKSQNTILAIVLIACIAILPAFAQIPSPTLNSTYLVQFNGTTYSVPYIIKGGTISNMNILTPQYMLEITLNTNSDGNITISLPRTMIDAKQGNVDAKFGVLINGNQVTQFGETINQDTRILNITFHNGDSKIDIVGTQAVGAITPKQYRTCPDCPDNNSIGQQTPPLLLTVATDKPVYDHNSQIMITGHVVNPYPGQNVNIKITSPSDNVVLVANPSLDENNDYHTTASTVGNMWFENGPYEIIVQYGDESTRTNSTFFQLVGPAPQIAPVIVTVSTDKPTYHHGDKIFISGTVARDLNVPVFVKVLDPLQHILFITQVSLNQDKTFSTNVTGTWNSTGMYSIYVNYEKGNADRFFQFIGNNNTSSSAITPTQNYLKNIPVAQSNQTIAAEIDVGRDNAQTRSIDNSVQVKTTRNTPDSFGVQVSATNQTGPKVIVFNINATTINVKNLKDLGVMYDGKPIAPAPNMDAILHAKPTDEPSFAIIVTQNGVQVLVLIPHFSTHTITITNMTRVIPAVPEFGPVAGFVIVVSMIVCMIMSRRLVIDRVYS